jgi:hypothetical protein
LKSSTNQMYLYLNKERRLCSADSKRFVLESRALC